MEKKMKIFKEIIAKYNSFAIISHLNPDGDNLGSIIAIYEYLNNQNKKVYPLEYDNIPSHFNFITEGIPFTDKNNIEVDVLIAVDCGDKNRLGNIDYIFNNAKEIIKIDHHLSNDNYGSLNIVNSDISSTCELIAQIFSYNKIELSEKISTALLMGILTDTGRFLYERADCSTFKTVTSLMESGADKNLLMYKLFQSNSLSSLKAINEINANAEFYYNNFLVISSVSKEFLDKYHVELSEVENAINYYRDTKEVEVSCMIKEKAENIYKVSLRSKRIVDVNKIAESFGGGGHKFASGCVIKGDLEKVKDKIIEKLKEFYIE